MYIHILYINILYINIHTYVDKIAKREGLLKSRNQSLGVSLIHYPHLTATSNALSIGLNDTSWAFEMSCLGSFCKAQRFRIRFRLYCHKSILKCSQKPVTVASESSIPLSPKPQRNLPKALQGSMERYRKPIKVAELGISRVGTHFYRR